jgi:DNA repair exonuclease SbcCD ATPase subunit
MTSDLKRMASQIKGLPVQDALKRRLNQYNQVRGQLEINVQALRETKGQVDGLRILSGRADLLTESEAKKLNSIQRRAGELRKLLRLDSPESAELSKHLQPIRDAAKSLKEEVQEEWASICRSDQEYAKAFRSLAEKFDPDAKAKFDDVIDRLQHNSVNPPVTADHLRAVRETRQHLKSAVQSLRMDGPVSQFLLDAIHGKGDPKALMDADVRAYLDQHPVLWHSLHVRLG